LEPHTNPNGVVADKYGEASRYTVFVRLISWQKVIWAACMISLADFGTKSIWGAVRSEACQFQLNRRQQQFSHRFLIRFKNPKYQWVSDTRCLGKLFLLNKTILQIHLATATSGSGLHLEAIDRIGSIPLVESSVKRVETIYDKVKNNNRLFSWYFETAEATISAAYETIQPAVKLFEPSIQRLDNVMCKSLDILEQRIPLVYLPPEMVSNQPGNLPPFADKRASFSA